ATTAIYTLSLHDALPIYDHVLYAKGVDIPPFESGLAAGVAAPAPPSATGVKNAETESRPASIDDALATANKADVVVLFVGELARSEEHTSELQSPDHIVC